MTVFERRKKLGVVGHRGGRGEGWPTENTMAAFERAYEEGADAIELDVSQCGTGEVVVFHDPDLKRTSGGSDLRTVSAVPYLELATKHKTPLLRDVLAFCNDRKLGLNVEIKYDDIDPRTLTRAVCRLIGAHPDLDVIVSSFDPRLLARVRALRGDLRCALLTTTERKWSLPLARFAMVRGIVWAVHLEKVQATERVIRGLRRRGLRVGVWTVNDVDEANRLRSFGVDWIITDAPGLMAEGAVRA
ncbi:MAG TPA: glycerophosphodiester phosphodiesterase [Polyangiaceae bacterium]